MNVGTTDNISKKKPKHLRRFVWVLGLVTLYVLGTYTIPRFPFGPYTLYGKLTQEERAAVIPYESLTDEQSYPFQTINSNRDHRQAIDRFRNVRDCLVQSEQSKQVPDLRLIDWDKIHNMSDADVCTWQIFSSLGTPERAAGWLVFHGANSKANLHQKVNRPSSVKLGLPTYTIKDVVRAEWPTTRLLFPTRSLSPEKKRYIWPWGITVPGQIVSTAWDSKGKLRAVYWKWHAPL